MKSMIQILLATYNGEKYIREQLESLLSQDFKDWEVLIHDDGSQDCTVDIVKRYCEKYPNKFFLLEDQVRFGNSRDNFSYLLEKSSSEYVMFCDQDDVWLPHKVAKTYSAMLSLESKLSTSIPCVVHSDLEIVDHDLCQISPSMFRYQGLYTDTPNLLESLAKNSVTGCTMMLNSSARKVSLPISTKAVMHDWWIAAKVIKHGGSIQWINEPLIKYRQHSSNAVGAKRNSVLQLARRAATYIFNHGVRSTVWQQAKAVDPSISYSKFFFTKLLLSIKSVL